MRRLRPLNWITVALAIIAQFFDIDPKTVRRGLRKWNTPTIR